PLSSIQVENVLDVTATINWIAPDPEAEYLIELGLQDFEPGTGDSLIFQGNTSGRLDLSEKTAYAFYLTTLCANGDTSQVLGPFNFETSYTLDVGAVDILAPFTACDLPRNDTVITVLKNFGAKPQSLIPFAYSINSQEVSIDMPRDGIYTGVLGKDSTDTAEFDARGDFSTPGAYFVEVWTAVEGDSDPTNDTTALTFYSIPTINELPYVEDFEGDFSGWTVGADSENPSWELGAPTGGIINRAAKGRNAWATNLNGVGNASEQSYLVSPCMDFRNVATDPLIAFQLWSSTERDVDQFWLESSIDGGNSWARVEMISYNGTFQSFTGDSPVTDWERQFGTLSGLAGQADVQLRFVYFSDFATQLEGVAIDDIQVFERGTTDLLLNSVYTVNEPACVTAENALLELLVTNIGQEPITEFTFTYQIFGELPATETISGLNIAADQSEILGINIPVDTLGITNVLTWVNAPNDTNPANDTIQFEVAATLPAPFVEDFESGSLPSNWSVNTNNSLVTNGHGNTSYVFAQNLRLQSPQLILTSPFIGPIAAGDTLSFDYRFVEFINNSAKALGNNDRLEVAIAGGCDGSFDLITTIDQNTHTTTNALTQVELALDAYAGEIIQIRITSTWGGGNYWVDLDNFEIPRCDGDLLLDALFVERVDRTELTTIVPLEGVGPYAYEWSSGETSSSVISPELGPYSVTVTDRFGCQGTFSRVVVSVDDFTTLEGVELFPNPTKQSSQLRLQFEAPMDAQIQLFNAIGQPIFERQERNVQQANIDLNMAGKPAGLYFVKVTAEGKSTTKRLMLMR
ncbi:MAG: T9SS type A sorting domain-containing protein, partial [Bacteroidota bacterium]